MRIIALTLAGIITFGYASADTPKIRYWFDRNNASAVEKEINPPQDITVDASELFPGVHELFMQYASDGITFAPVQSYFILRTAHTEADILSISVDGETIQTLKVDSSESMHIESNFTNLPEGLHSIAISLMRQDGFIVSNYRSLFLRIATDTELKSFTVAYYIDNKFISEEPIEVNPTGTMIHTKVDVSDVDYGLHHLNVILKSASGDFTHNYSALFINVPLSENEYNINYVIDDTITGTETCSMSDGTFHINLNLQSLDYGIHTILISAIDSNGLSSETYSSTFEKRGQSGIDEIRLDNNNDIFFDLWGRKVKDNMTPGIYLKDGKKIFIKANRP